MFADAVAWVIDWLDGHEDEEPARADVLLILRGAVRDPSCPIGASWPIVRMCELDPLASLRDARLADVWALVWAAWGYLNAEETAACLAEIAHLCAMLGKMTRP